MDWIKTKLIDYQTIGEEDLNLIKMTDDPEEVLEFMLEHRKWKNIQRELAEHQQAQIYCQELCSDKNLAL